jgi:hypothetical protein
MADKATPASGKEALRQDALVENLVPTAGKQEPTVQLAGWLGKGDEDGTWNLYLSPALDEYVQFSENDVVHSQPLTAESAPLGGTSVWLKTDASLKHVQVTTHQIQAGFLSGSITSGNLSSATASLPGVTAQIATIFANSIGARANVCPRPGTGGALCSPTAANCVSGPGPICASGIIGCG